MITKEFIDKLAARYAAITKKGEWMSLERGHPDKRGWRLFVSYASPHMGGSPVPVCELSNCNARGTGYEEAALIAALYNAWPTIEKALRKQLRASKPRLKLNFTNEPYGPCDRCRTVGFWNCPKHRTKPRKTKKS